MFLFTSFCFLMGLQVTFFSVFQSGCCCLGCHFPFVIVRGIIIRVHHCQIFVVVVDLPKQWAISICFVVYFLSWSVNQMVAAANVVRLVVILLLMPIVFEATFNKRLRSPQSSSISTVNLTQKRSNVIVRLKRNRTLPWQPRATVKCRYIIVLLRKNHRA